MRVRPLTGQCLVELFPPCEWEGSLILPQSAQEVKSSPENIYVRQGAVKGKVVEMGAWPKAKNGYARLPDFGMGAIVLVPPHTGQQLAWETTGRLRLIRQDEVLAVLG